MKYRSSVFYRYKNKLISIGWCLCSAYIIFLTFIIELKPEFLQHIDDTILKAFPILSVLLIAQFFCVYTFIVVRVRLQNQKHRNQRQSKKLVLPIIIIFTFIIFKALPDIALLVKKYQGKRFIIYYDISSRLNMVSDALIYLCMLPAVQAHTNKWISFLVNITSSK